MGEALADLQTELLMTASLLSHAALWAQLVQLPEHANLMLTMEDTADWSSLLSQIHSKMMMYARTDQVSGLGMHRLIFNFDHTCFLI